MPNPTPLSSSFNQWYVQVPALQYWADPGKVILKGGGGVRE